MGNKAAKAELIQIAAELAVCRFIPSDIVDDYPQKTYSAERVANMMEAPRCWAKVTAVKLRELADSIDRPCGD